MIPATAECAVYGGIAALGEIDGWDGMWQLTTMAIIAVALRQAVAACAGPAPPGRPSRRTHARRIAANPPVIARVALAVAGLAVHGPRVAIFLVLAMETVSLLVALGRIPAGSRAGAGSARIDSPAASRDAARTPTGRTPPGSATTPTRLAIIRASRDDGALIRWAGRLVQGNLLPLAPAIAGLTATAMLALLGMGNLHGIIALTPPVVMLLAAPGAGHRHDGRFDWLVPVILQAAQYLYLSTLGFAWHVPAPIVYLLCALTAVWHAVLALPIEGKPSGIGWEGRMFIAGAAAITGLASFAYPALAAYLGVLISRRVMTGTLYSLEDARR